MSTVRIVLLIIIATVVGYLSFGVYQYESDRRAVKDDLIELSNVKYGLFNVDQWKNILADLIVKKVEEFDFSEGGREELKAEISEFLTTTINDFERRYNRSNSGSFSGFLRRSVANITDIFGQMKKDIPIFTEQIVNFMDNPENKGQIKKYLLEEIDKYTEGTFAQIDYAERDRILLKYDQANMELATNAMKANVADLEKSSERLKTVLFVLAGLAGLFTLFGRNLIAPEYMLLTLLSLFLLAGGLALPMIDIDARISEMNFNLMGETVRFEDQVLFFKSKSILEIVQLMMSQGKTDVFLVGLLVLLFSVLFPVTKLICSTLYIYSKGIRKNRFINFMVFKSGKWSMADVMVVAVFMAYIGFSGILNEQLNQLGSVAQSVDMLSTNNTTLQIGFFLFTAFVVLSLLISQRLSGLAKQVQLDNTN